MKQSKKQSKKVQRQMNKVQRKTWGFSPVTRKEENPRAYNRSKHKEETKRDVEFSYV